MQQKRKVRRSPVALKATAYHEAGHAVAAYRLGIGLGRKGVTIVPDGDFLGSAHILKGFRDGPEGGVTDTLRIKVGNRIIVMLAGEAAQQKFSPRSVRSYQGSSDRERAALLLLEYSGSTEEAQKWVDYLSVRAEGFVGHPVSWMMIEAVAAALLERSTLSRDDFTAVCQQAVREAVAKHGKGA